MIRMAFYLALSIGATLSLGLGGGAAPQAQESEKKVKSTTTNKKPQRPTAANQANSGYPSCTAGVLWVDSMCQLPDGRVCFVGELELHNCR